MNEASLASLMAHVVDNRGRTCPTAETGLPLIATNCVKSDSLYPTFEKVRYVDEDTYRDWFRGHPLPGDLIFVLKGSPGEVCLTPDPVPFCIAQDMVALRPDPDKVYPPFLFAALRSNRTKSDILNMHVGTMIPHFKKGDFDRLFIPIPNRDDQQAIGDAYLTISKKIELNRRMNETLEEMARALFRDWFVDFGPTRRQMEGATDPAAIMGHAFPPEKAATLAPLFPARLGDDGLPEGWTRQPIGDFVHVLETGRRPKGGVKGIDGGVPSVGAESIKHVGVFDFGKTKYVPQDFFEAMNSGHVEDGDILIYKDGGKPGELRPAVSYVSNGFPFETFCINEHVFRLRLNGIPQVTGYCALTTDDAFWQMRELATGVAQPGLNQKSMKSVSIISPSDPSLFSTFAEIATPLIDGCNQNAKQNQTLAEMRDLLLPKLMSGEIRLKDAGTAA